MQDYAQTVTRSVMLLSTPEKYWSRLKCKRPNGSEQLDLDGLTDAGCLARAHLHEALGCQRMRSINAGRQAGGGNAVNHGAAFPINASHVEERTESSISYQALTFRNRKAIGRPAWISVTPTVPLPPAYKRKYVRTGRDCFCFCDVSGDAPKTSVKPGRGRLERRRKRSVPSRGREK